MKKTTIRLKNEDYEKLKKLQFLTKDKSNSKIIRSAINHYYAFNKLIHN